MWMITVAVTGFLLGEPAFSMNGYYGHRFISAQACETYARSGEMDDEAMRLRRIAEAHLKDPTTKITVVFTCAIVTDGEPA